MVLPVKKSLAVIAPQQPRLPSAPREYDPAYQDQFTDILRLYFNQLQNFNQLIVGPTGGSYLQFPNGAFHDSTTQTQSLANTAKAITFNATDNSNAITIGTSTSRIITSISGYYNFQFSAQLDKTSGGASSVWIWAKVNGVNIPNSTGKIAIQSTTSETVPAWNFVLPMQADDYFELYWMTDDTNTQLKADVAFGTAPNDVPAIPSVILTATFVSALFS